jgi:predicted amidohydrolase YtcJ
MKNLSSAFLISTLVAALAACQPAEESVIKIPADLILSNGKVVSVDEEFSIHSTIVVSDGKVVELGDASLLDKYEAVTVRDLDGKTLIPGFIDSHTHISGDPQRYINLSEITSIAEMQDLIRAKAEELGAGEWITGYGWSEDELAEGRKPLRGDLDIAAPRNPVTLTRAGGHSAVVSTSGLGLAEINNNTPDPEGGVIERDENGVANGIIRERQNIVGRLVPDSTYEELLASLEINLGNLLAKGITSITDASTAPDEYAMWEELYAKPDVKLPRSAVQFQWFDPEGISEVKERVGDGNEFLRIGPIKVFADGGFTGPAAFTKEPYLNQGDYRGYLNMPAEELVAHINEIHDAGWQMGVHAIGDAAIELVVDTLAVRI